jgi:benzodiazapine receptor
MKRFGSLALFLLLVVGGGFLLGTLSRPGEWYQNLVKPPLNPPDWVFGPVWTVLYILIAIVGWRCWQAASTGRRMQLWWAQLVLNFLWPPLFFGLEQMALALVVILLLLVTILAFISASWRTDRLSALLFVPYALWVSFATYLNLSLLLLN